MNKPMRPPAKSKPPGAPAARAAGRTPTAQAARRPAAPPVYRPRDAALQPKAAGAKAPPPYRPQPTPKVLQKKEAAPQPRPAAGPKGAAARGPSGLPAGHRGAPAAPSAYRPRPVPTVLQSKAAAPARPTTPAPPRVNAAPRARARPHAPSAAARPPAQPKMAPGARPSGAAPPRTAPRAAVGRAGVIQRLVHLNEANVDVDETSFAAVRDALLDSRQHARAADYAVLKGLIIPFTVELANEYGVAGGLSRYFASDREERNVIADVFCNLRGANDPASQVMARRLKTDGVALKHVFETASRQGRAFLGEVRDMQRDHPLLVARMDENERMRQTVGAVSLPSAAHWLEEIADKYWQVANHLHGFSFCARATMVNDVAVINAYLDLIRDDALAALDSPIRWEWNNHPNGRRVEFTVNGRVYSTHAVPGHPQLYPLSGAGVLHGNGPLDMARHLLGRGQLGETQKIKLYQVYCGRNGIACKQTPPGQMGSKDKIAYAAALDDLI